MTSVLTRNWWALALRGILAILLGLAAIVLPGVTLAVLITLFGAYALVDGVLAIIAGVRAAERHERWWSPVLKGLAGIAAGDRKSTRLNSSHGYISYAVFCLKKKKKSPYRTRCSTITTVRRL